MAVIAGTPAPGRAVDWLADVTWGPALVSVLVWAITLSVLGEPREWAFDAHAAWTSYSHATSGTVHYFGMLAGMLLAALALVLRIELTNGGARYAALAAEQARNLRVVNVLNVAMGQTEALALTVAGTELGKVLVGELRPDFRDRCLGADYDPAAAYPLYDYDCTATDADTVEGGRMAFPSGHSSSSMAIGMYLSVYLYWCLFHRRGARWAAAGRSRFHAQAVHTLGLLALGPVVVSLIVGYSRIVHNRHHPWDVMAGFWQGAIFAWFAAARTFSLLARADGASSSSSVASSSSSSSPLGLGSGSGLDDVDLST